MTTPSTSHNAYPVWGLGFGFAGAALLGFLIGFIYLATVSPKAVLASEAEPLARTPISLSHFETEVRFYESPSLRQNAHALARKLYASQTQQIEISALELNAWAGANLSSHALTPIGGEESTAPILSLIPQVPVFQIAEQLLHVSYPATLHIGNIAMPLRLIASGDFTTGSNGPEWNTQRLYINSAPVPFKQWVFRVSKPPVMRALEKNPEVEKMQTAWKRIRSIQVGSSTLQVERS